MKVSKKTIFIHVWDSGGFQIVPQHSTTVFVFRPWPRPDRLFGRAVA
jgi:hypothetical protein